MGSNTANKKNVPDNENDIIFSIKREIGTHWVTDSYSEILKYLRLKRWPMNTHEIVSGSSAALKHCRTAVVRPFRPYYQTRQPRHYAFQIQPKGSHSGTMSATVEMCEMT